MLNSMGNKNPEGPQATGQGVKQWEVYSKEHFLGPLFRKGWNHHKTMCLLSSYWRGNPEGYHGRYQKLLREKRGSIRMNFLCLIHFLSHQPRWPRQFLSRNQVWSRTEMDLENQIHPRIHSSLCIIRHSPKGMLKTCQKCLGLLDSVEVGFFCNF